MYIKQISAFIENSHGRLTDFTDILGAEGVDLIALSIADTTNFGILRAIVADSEKAIKAIREKGFTANRLAVFNSESKTLKWVEGMPATEKISSFGTQVHVEGGYTYIALTTTDDYASVYRIDPSVSSNVVLATKALGTDVTKIDAIGKLVAN